VAIDALDDAADGRPDNFGRVVGAHTDDTGFQPVQCRTGDETRLRAARRTGVHDDIGHHILLDQLPHRRDKSERADRGRRTEGNEKRIPAFFSETRESILARIGSCLARRDVLDLRAKQLGEEQVSTRLNGRHTVQDQYAVEPAFRRGGRGRASVIRLNTAHRDECVRAFGERLGDRELELPNLVTAEPERNGVVAFGQQTRSATERRSKPRQFLDRRWSGEQRET
jgi:hypothetical protein